MEIRGPSATLPPAPTPREAFTHVAESRLGRIRKLRDRILTVGTQFVLVSLQTLLHLLASLTRAHVLGVRLARSRDSPVFTSLNNSDQNKRTN